MHNPTIRTWFEARKSICTIYYRLLGCTGKNKAKNGRLGSRRGETGSRYMAANPKIERALATSYRPSICSNFSSILTRFRDIAAFVLQHATFSHPTLVSPKFLHVPLGIGGWSLDYEERRCWANFWAISFQDFPPM